MLRGECRNLIFASGTHSGLSWNKGSGFYLIVSEFSILYLGTKIIFMPESIEMGCVFSCTDCLASLCPCYSGNEKPNARTQIADNPELLNKQLNQVRVMSSHNSYIHTLQIGSESSIKGIEIALNKGARCLELDLFRDESTGEIFVAHGQEKTPDLIVTTKMPLAEALDFIANNAFVNTSDPLFIALEINCHREEAACDRIAYLLEQYFGERLYKGLIKPNVLLSELVAKIVLIQGGAAGNRLLSVVNGEWGSELQNAACTINPSQLAFGSAAIRIYPTGFESDIISANYDPLPMLEKGATFVAMNMCMNDYNMQVYENYFKTSSFI